VGDSAEEILLGEIIGVFGFRGELRVLLHNREDSALAEERAIVLVGPDGERRDTRMVVRPGAGKRFLARVPGVVDEAAARALQGWQILIRRDALPAPKEGEFYIHDLVGCEVVDEDGPVGTVLDVVPGEKDVWVIDTPEGEAWIVASPDVVLGVDMTARVVTVQKGAATAL
jgi:16S rRNA processing protein RimM